MEYGFLRVGVATPKITLGDPEKNVACIVNAMKEANRLGVELLSFPELVLTGATAGDLFFHSGFIGAAKKALLDIARQTENLETVAAVGLPIFACGKLYNAYALVGQGKIYGYQYKNGYSGNGISENSRYFVAATTEDSRLFSLNGKLFGICFYDDLGNLAHLTRAGASVILCPTAAPAFCFPSKYADKNYSEVREEELSVLSRRTRSILVFANAGEGESVTDVCYTGGSWIFENGEQMGIGNLSSSGLLEKYADVDIDVVTYTRCAERQEQGKNLPIIDISVPLNDSAKLEREYVKHPFQGANSYRQASDTFQIQVEALKRRILHTGVSVVVIGVSGGLDSTLALLVSVKAMLAAGKTEKDVVAVTMPCVGTSGRTYQNAKKLMQNLGVTEKEISIEAAFRQHLKDLGHSGAADTAYENAQARERTQILMDLSNMLGGFVVGTGDLSELALGFATYNGDHMSMYNVNASIPKTLMQSMLTELSGDFGEELSGVIKDVVFTPVSPELTPAKNGEIAQITEEIIGPYELHDFFLYHFLKSGMSAEKLHFIAKKTFKESYGEEELKKWQNVFFRRFFAAQFKRSCAPDGINATGFSLSPRGGVALGSDIKTELFYLK